MCIIGEDMGGPWRGKVTCGVLEKGSESVVAPEGNWDGENPGVRECVVRNEKEESAQGEISGCAC